MDEATGSRTARVVAAGRAVGVAGRRDEHVESLLPPADRVAVAAARALGAGRRRRVLGWAAHAGLRMLAVDAAVRDALGRAGSRTLVVLGAGYDTRAWRLEALRGHTVVEVDHPATQAAKRVRLAAVGDPLAELVLAGADLAEADLGQVLAGAGHDPDLPTTWLWEAVVPYLPAAAVDRTLDVVARRSAAGSVLLVTTVLPHLVGPRSLGRAAAGVARAAMRRIGEPVELAEDDDAVAARLARSGFMRREVTGPREWAADAGVRLQGPWLEERLHVAERRA